MTKTTTTARKPASLPRYGVMNHDRFLGYVQGKDHADAFARAQALHPHKRLTLEPIRSGRHPLGKSVQADLNESFQSKRAPYPVGDFEARRRAEIAKAMASGLI